MSSDDLENIEGMADFLSDKWSAKRGFNSVATRRTRVLSRQRAEATKRAKAGKTPRVTLAAVKFSEPRP